MIADAPLVLRHRRSMLFEAGSEPRRVQASLEPFVSWVMERVRDGRYVGFVAEDDRGAVGSVGFIVHDWPPHPKHPHDGRRGYVLNLYVEPDCRRQRVGTTLTELAEGEGRRRGLHFLMLHATPHGRPLYEARGWTPITNEMGLTLVNPIVEEATSRD